ncbi:MAG: hypothetical protein QUV02_05910 [Maricaulis sp.]|uniref:hypothetical protein n=1 Tax=Maricaulis sp. TaxID=1486257 RepID=UPI001B230488|nr:hypothetical protein [Maricaulis sp.]MBO6730693.1 hypothetical protein [Maricaulis sp.]MBO6847101.1 hypothetical protein [Maricaulis sp.]MBO6877332.1 hypothetical protein [Maricaulis sp.]MDM7983966.1 hypothetical protein [Maricaulis sp.]
MEHSLIPRLTAQAGQRFFPTPTYNQQAKISSTDCVFSVSLRSVFRNLFRKIQLPDLLPPNGPHTIGLEGPEVVRLDSGQFGDEVSGNEWLTGYHHTEVLRLAENTKASNDGFS